MAKDIGRKGIGGWLAVLIFWMIVLRPSGGVFVWLRMHDTVPAGGDADGSSPLINTSIFWLLILTSAALGIYAGTRLLRERSPGAVRAAVAIIWITVPLGVLAGMVARAYFEGGVDLARTVTTLAVQTAIATLATGYLLRSRRVKNTYCGAAGGSADIGGRDQG